MPEPVVNAVAVPVLLGEERMLALGMLALCNLSLTLKSGFRFPCILAWDFGLWQPPPAPPISSSGCRSIDILKSLSGSPGIQ